ALEGETGTWVDWRRPELLPIYRSALASAHFARLIAEHTRRCDPDTAWAAGLLAPLGWMAVAAADPAAVAACLSGPRHGIDPLGVREARWGMDQAEIARKLGRRWLLPDWLRIPVGHNNLPLSVAIELGAEPALFATVQLAATLAEESETPLGLSAGVDRA